MSNDPVSPSVSSFLETIERFQKELIEHGNLLKKISARLDVARKSLKSKPSIAAQIHPLITDLQAMKLPDASPTPPMIVATLNELLNKYQAKLSKEFPLLLKEATEAANIPFKPIANGFGIGPFEVVLDVAKEIASIHYAKLPVKKNIPLEVIGIVNQVITLKQSLIESPVDIPSFRKDIQEAIRVAVIRREGALPSVQLRADLPAVFREVHFIRTFINPTAGKKGDVVEYSLARFVIELKALIASDENVQSATPFKLETAVIENSKNPKKSIFVPKDTTIGFGEGTYYQAITLPQR
ncbi:MAG: hypothetical protein ACK5ZC_00890 [Pirellulaceae bacterium]|jgi:hypothetical protein